MHKVIKLAKIFYNYNIYQYLVMMQRNRESHYMLMLEYSDNIFLQDDLAMESPQLTQTSSLLLGI